MTIDQARQPDAKPGDIQILDVKYGPEGTYNAVLKYLNIFFTPTMLLYTKDQWTKNYDPKAHAFGKFASKLMTPLLGSNGFPDKATWDRDCTSYNANPIDPDASREMADALRENLDKPQPSPMYFTVVGVEDPDGTAKHKVTRVEAMIENNTWLIVIMHCPYKPNAGKPKI